MTKNWPISSNHFNSSGNVYSLRRKYYFSDKNSDTFDVNNQISKISNGLASSSYIKEGLVVASSTSTSITLSYGSFYHYTDSSIFNQPITLSGGSGFITNNTHDNAFVHVGRLFDQPIQSVGSTAGYLVHKIKAAGSFSDPMYGTLTIDRAKAYLASDFGDTRTDYINTGSPSTNNTLNLSGLTSGSNYDLFIDYTPDLTTSWVDHSTINSGTAYTAITASSPTSLQCSAAPFVASDLGKWVTFVSGTYAGQKRQIVNFVSTTEVEIEALSGNVSGTFYFYAGQALFPTTDITRYDCVGIRKKVYEVKKNVLGVDANGIPTITNTTSRYFTTFQIVIQEGVTITGPSSNYISDLDGSYIPLALIKVTRAGASVSIDTSYNYIFSWLFNTYRERELHDDNLIPNGGFEAWSGSQPFGWVAGNGGSGVTITKAVSPLYRNGSFAANISTTSALKALYVGGKLSELGVNLGDAIEFSGWLAVQTASDSARLHIILSSDSAGNSILYESYASTQVTAPRTTSTAGIYDFNKCYFSIPTNDFNVTTDSYLLFFVETTSSGTSTVLADDLAAYRVGSSLGGKPKAVTDAPASQYLTGNLYVAGSVSALGGVSGSNSNFQTQALASGSWIASGSLYYQEVAFTAITSEYSFIVTLVDTDTKKVIIPHDIEVVAGPKIRIWVSDNSLNLRYNVMFI